MLARTLPVALLAAACVDPLGDELVINEVVPQNTQAAGGLVDWEGGSADWYELYNRSSAPVSLRGVTVLGPDGATWRVPRQTVIEGHGYLLVFADNTPTRGPELHSPLQLGEEGVLELIGPDGASLDVVFWPPMLADHAWARVPDGGPRWREVWPTPLAPNPELVE